jgi:hypothetical protein
MTYNVTLTYRDDKTVNVVMPENQIQDFFDNLSSGKVHLNTQTNVGFWTTVDQLRHIIVHPYKENADESGEKNQGSPKTLPEGDENSVGGKNPAGAEA